ncbi:hypothetical protein [Micromonospora sp. SH-82]|uniref:hypothetical protein n=1 Tax=Micromonospora sp. SH-82 TaxID=3132938 RepID=UPI003EC0F64F
MAFDPHVRAEHFVGYFEGYLYGAAAVLTRTQTNRIVTDPAVAEPLDKLIEFDRILKVREEAERYRATIGVERSSFREKVGNSPTGEALTYQNSAHITVTTGVADPFSYQTDTEGPVTQLEQRVIDALSSSGRHATGEQARQAAAEYEPTRAALVSAAQPLIEDAYRNGPFGPSQAKVANAAAMQGAGGPQQPSASRPHQHGTATAPSHQQTR